MKKTIKLSELKGIDLEAFVNSINEKLLVGDHLPSINNGNGNFTTMIDLEGNFDVKAIKSLLSKETKPKKT